MFNLGFNNILSLSEKIFILITVINKKNPGYKLIQYFPTIIYSYPLEIIRPSDGSVIGKPTPQNESDASNVIAKAKFIVLNTIIGGKQFGNK